MVHHLRVTSQSTLLKIQKNAHAAIGVTNEISKEKQPLD